MQDVTLDVLDQPVDGASLDSLQNTTAQNNAALSEIETKWSDVIALLEKEVGTTTVKNWIHPLVILSDENQTLKFSAPTRFLADWVRSHYTDAIRRLWSSVNGSIFSVEFTVDASATKLPAKDQTDDKTQAPANENGSKTVLELGSRLDPKMTFETFVVGSSNALAEAAARRVAENEMAVFNPLFFYSSVGLGKTHLMHAIGWEIKSQYPEKRVSYLSAEKFMYQFVRAIRENDTVTFKQALRDVDVLMIDDIQFISGKASTQQEFIHTFNALLDEGKQVIIAADKNPAEINGLDKRLQSRLAGGLMVDIQPADFALRAEILRRKAAIAGKTIPDEVLDFLAEKIATNIRELEGTLNRLIAHADLINQKITLESTQKILGDLFRAHDKKITIDDIQKQVVSFYDLKLGDMTSTRRLRAIARPRQIAMYLAKKLTPASLPHIGREFGGRDHTTVMHAVRKVEDLIKTDELLAADITKLENRLQSIG